MDNPSVFPIDAVGKLVYYSRKKFERYFLERGQVDFRMGGTPYSILIDDAECFPQAYAAAIPIFHKLQQIPKAMIVDIGVFTAFILKYLQLNIFYD